ncbi:Uncharacterized protein FKW44_025328, partial [Caligus rogercresseyi]
MNKQGGAKLGENRKQSKSISQLIELIHCISFIFSDKNESYHPSGLSGVSSYEAKSFDNNSKVLKEIRINSVRMAEANLFNEDSCFFRTMCSVGSQRTVPVMTLAAGIVGFRKILEKVMGDIQDLGIDQQSFPSIYRAVGSYEVGIETKNLDLCEKLFPCAHSAAYLLREAVAKKK